MAFFCCSSSNAKKLLEFSSRQGYNHISWELGNEPNSLKHQLGFQLPGKQLGKDFKRLRKLLNRFEMYKNSSLIGPDVNQLRAQSPSQKVQKALKYLKDVYDGSLMRKKSVLEAITWHHYYFDGHKAQLEDFLSEKALNYLPKMMITIQRFMNENQMNDKPVWLGETSSAYGGGAHGLSDRFFQ